MAGINGVKRARSWQMSGSLRHLGRKKVDWSVFEYGLHIPQALHSEFLEVNGGSMPPWGSSDPVRIELKGKRYNARLVNVARKGALGLILQIRYDSNEALKESLRNVFQRTYLRLLSLRCGHGAEPGDPEYMDFFYDGEQSVVRVERCDEGTLPCSGQSRRLDEGSIGTPSSGGVWFFFEDVRKPSLTVLAPSQSSPPARRRAPQASGAHPAQTSEEAAKRLLHRLITSHLSTSYKPVTLLCMLEEHPQTGAIALDSLANRFVSFYLRRQQNGQVVESDRAAIVRALRQEDGARRAMARQILRQSPLMVFGGVNLLAVDGSLIVLSEGLRRCLLDPARRARLEKLAREAVDGYFQSLEAGN